MLNLSDPRPRSMYDLDLWYSYRLMNSFSLTVSTNFDIINYKFLKNPLFYIFPLQKHKGQNLTFP